MEKTIISFFDYTETWVQPYKDAGYPVVCYDLKIEGDIMKISPVHIAEEFKPYGLLFAPPCTDFSLSGSWKWEKKDQKGTNYCPCCETTTEHSISLVRYSMAIAEACKKYLQFWALENPVGRINKLVPELGNPWFFQPWWYGDPYTKKTALYGNFKPPIPYPDLWVKPTEQSKMYKKYGGNSERTKELRSITPSGFAKQFFNQNP